MLPDLHWSGPVMHAPHVMSSTGQVAVVIARSVPVDHDVHQLLVSRLVLLLTWRPSRRRRSEP